ncbi:hypothetical protein VB796_20940 [Arcicella sp. LKC2W]|uniref:hypothetical protein n=1 Tax=Arcicella sp. LKC2W TaxID=2984198 RepID=UPI002B1F96C2|nr:hypothetical protein [Arcicella sp. LKC2W]MEA5461546.1 hypothetical protein [Arcicella sp. LKC2W]
MKRDIDYLKDKFQVGDVPSGQDFNDLMDSFVHKDEDLGSIVVTTASRSQAEAGTDNVTLMTPLRTKQAIAALARLSVLPNLKADIVSLIELYVDGDTVAPPSLPACPRQLTIVSFTNTTGNDYSVTFDAEGVSSITWEIFNNANTSVLTGTSPALTVNTFTMRAILPSGDYKIVFAPTNCTSADETIRTKTFSVVSTSLPFSITGVTIERFSTKLKATVVVSNTTNVTLEYSKDGVTYQTSNVFDNLTETNKFYARQTSTPANIVEFTKQDSLTDDWFENEIRDYEIAEPTMLNAVDLSSVPDFEIPNHPNPRYVGQKVFENILKGPNWRGQSTAGDAFLKGFTHIDVGLLELGTERQVDPYNSSFVSTIPLGKLIQVGGGGDYEHLALGVSGTAAQMDAIPYNQYNDILNDYKYNVPQKFKGSDSIFKGGFIGFDLENGSFHLGLQSFVNRIVMLHYVLLEASAENTDVSLMYQSLPLQLVGFGVKRSHYNTTADATWTTPAANVGNGFPTELVGKSLRTLSSRMRCKFEYYLLYEAYLPEGYRLLNKQNTNLTDWAGNDTSLLTHFNIAAPSYMHWAAHTAAGLGVQRPHLNGKSLMLQANHFNAAGNGYLYEEYAGATGQPQTTILKQAYDGLGRYPIPNYIVQGQIFIAIFSQATYYQWESNVLLTPEPKSTGEQVNQHPAPSYRNYRGVTAQAWAFRRLSVVKCKVGNQTYAIADMIDGTEQYMCEKTQVDYLSVSNYQGVKEVNPLDWIEFKLTPVLTIINEVKGLIAIWACQAYGVEQSSLDVVYNKNGYNFKKRITVPAGTNKLFIFSLTGN